jgi:glucose/arabinose dehydrogenase
VLRVASDGSSIETYATGFTAIVDLAFDNGGALYVLEVARGQVGPFPPPPAPNPGLGIGRLKRMCPGEAATVLLEGLTFPGGVAIGPDDAVYMTNFGTAPEDGEVLRLQVDPC